MAASLSLVLGGAASGKSSFAEALVLKQKKNPLYIATAQAFDPEMEAKIAAHIASRGSKWTTVEEPFDLALALDQADADHAVLIDCVTLWLTNLMLDNRDRDAALGELEAALEGCKAPVTVVSNEVGQGIAPENAMSRRFREWQGRTNVRLAARADLVVQVVAGLPNVLKGTLP